MLQKDLFLSAFLAYEVGATEDGEDSNACAEGGVSVASLFMTGQDRTKTTVAVFEVVFLLRRVAALEEAAAISEGRQAQSKDNSEG
jgi:hypothetical protein